ncbi:MAG: isopentenyl phosphate kinase [Hadesarchaea archaeon]|nr:isopentenyl phosphate kinase [Hadesarchaea archaeon]
MIDIRPLIVKLGGSVITDKRRQFTVKRTVLRRLARELTAAKGSLVLVHGGGSFGHPVASKYKIAEGYGNPRQLIGFALTHRAMEKLNAYVVDALQQAGVPAVAMQPSACAVVENGRIKSMELTPLRKLLKLGLVPVLYGDAVPDLGKGMSILSGDQLVAQLACELGAKRVILGVDVDGVYTVNPKTNKNAKLVQEISLSNWSSVKKRLSSGVGGRDVTGGMAKKVRELLALAERGVEAEIVNAAKPNILRRAILGEVGLGTRVVAR